MAENFETYSIDPLVVDKSPLRDLGSIQLEIDKTLELDGVIAAGSPLGVATPELNPWSSSMLARGSNGATGSTICFIPSNFGSLLVSHARYIRSRHSDECSLLVL